MKLSHYVIQELVQYVTGDEHFPMRSGPELVKLFNRYGSRDVYDELGLPDINKKMDIVLQESNTSKQDY